MNTRRHPKSIRRQILLLLYDHFIKDPLEMLTPDDFLANDAMTREELMPSIYYLHDRGLAEVMTGYNPPLFAAARITANGVDLVENAHELNVRFPAQPGDAELASADVLVLIERLVEEAECSALDGERRRCLLRDVQYLRDELARPVERWRAPVIDSVVSWIAGHIKTEEDALPSLARLVSRIHEVRPAS